MRPASRNPGSNRGFSLVELIVSMTVISILLAIVMNSTNGMLIDGQITKAQEEISTLKTAITSYWRQNGFNYPPDIHASLTGAEPTILDRPLRDPFNTDTTNNTFGYAAGSDSVFGPYFVIYTRGPRGDTAAPTWDATNQRFTYTGSGLAASNAPVLKY